MSEKEKGNWRETRSRLEKAGRIAALAGTLAVVAGCTREGEPVLTIEGVDETEPKVSEIQEAESTTEGEIRVTQEAFTGSIIKETEDLKLEITPTLDLGVEKTQAIVTKAKEKGLKVEEVSYLSFYKVDETGNRELVVILSVEKEGESVFYYVSGRKENKYVPVEASNEVELVELKEYTETEGGETTGLRFVTDEDDILLVIEMTKNGIFYTDPYIRVVTRMSEELSREVLAMVSSMPEGAEELIDRLGEKVEIVMNESGKYDLVYNQTVIGELDSEGQISFQVEEETITLATETLEVKDGDLVSINRQRTEEMGVDWVEQMWSMGEERVAVPEPQILLPETYEETLTVKEQALDYFMPKLVTAVKKYLNENGWGENDMVMGLPSLKDNTGLPYGYREVDIYDYEVGWNKDGYKIVASSWFRVETEDGRIIDVIEIPFKAKRKAFGSSQESNFVWHFAFDDEATMDWMSFNLKRSGRYSENRIQEEVEKRRAETVFESLKEGDPRLVIWVFVDTGSIEEMEGFEQEGMSIERHGFENMAKLLSRLDSLEGGVVGYSDMLGRQMVYWGAGSDKPVPNPSREFLDAMEMEIIPSARIN